MLLPELNSHTNNYFNRTCQNPTKVHFHQPNRLHLPNGPINTKVNTTKSRDNTLCQVSNFFTEELLAALTYENVQALLYKHCQRHNRPES